MLIDNAKKRHIRFDLRHEEAKALFLLPCYYCGTIDEDRSLDRLDSDANYTSSNVVPCCGRCNMMKGTLTVRDFQTATKNVAIESGQTTEAPSYEFEAATSRLTRPTYAEYTRRTTQRYGFAMELDQTTFEALLKYSCFYCGRPNLCNQQYNGLDRIDSCLPYRSDNAVPCCTVCNMMKRDLSLASYIEHCSKITTHLSNLPTVPSDEK